MNKIVLGALTGLMALTASSCMEVDNFDAPDARISAVFIDKTTGKPLTVSHGEGGIKLWEMGYKETLTQTSSQWVSLKRDATLYNDKLFARTYKYFPQGCWWDLGYSEASEEDLQALPEIKLTKKTPELRLEVIPYLHVTDFTMELDNSDPKQAYLNVSCTLTLPDWDYAAEGIDLDTDMPRIYSVRPFLSTNTYCGSSQCIGEYFNYDFGKNDVKKIWSKLDKDINDGSKTTPFTFHLPVKRGYHYWVRMGAQVENKYNSWCYGEIQEVEVPLTYDAAL